MRRRGGGGDVGCCCCFGEGGFARHFGGRGWWVGVGGLGGGF